MQYHEKIERKMANGRLFVLKAGTPMELAINALQDSNNPFAVAFITASGKFGLVTRFGTEIQTQMRPEGFQLSLELDGKQASVLVTTEPQKPELFGRFVEAVEVRVKALRGITMQQLIPLVAESEAILPMTTEAISDATLANGKLIVVEPTATFETMFDALRDLDKQPIAVVFHDPTAKRFGIVTLQPEIIDELKPQGVEFVVSQRERSPLVMVTAHTQQPKNWNGFVRAVESRVLQLLPTLAGSKGQLVGAKA